MDNTHNRKLVDVENVPINVQVMIIQSGRFNDLDRKEEIYISAHFEQYQMSS